MSRKARAPSNALAVLALIPLALCVLAGGDGCPITLNPPSSGGGGGSGGAAAAVDVQGTWALEYDDQVKVTLRTSTGQTSSAFVRPGGAPVALIDRTVDVTSFCWRVDVVCPEQVMLSQTVVAQSDSQLLVAFNRKGPLSTLDQQGLVGTLAGTQLSVPMGMVPQKSDPCTLVQGSAIHATATAAAAQPDGGTPRAESIEGEVTLRYSGQCFALGGSGALYADDLIEVSMRFTATPR
jgi:hypothetical protein